MPYSIVMLVLTAASLSAGTLESVFGEDPAAWRGTPTNVAKPTVASTEFGSGLAFCCDFTLADPRYPRCTWDLPVSLDISEARSLHMNVRVDNGNAVEKVALYFKSGNGWYSLKSHKVKEGWNAIVVPMNAFNIEGKPTGLDKIDMIRVNAFQLSEKHSTVVFAGVKTSLIAVESGPPSVFTPPDTDRNLPRNERRNANGCLLENRVILDEEPYFLKDTPSAVIERISKGGFNVYMPCVWHGRGAIYRSSTPLDPRHASRYDGGADPMKDLVEMAHAKNIEVHAWFCISLRESDIVPEYAEPGTPSGAFDLQNPGFRDFIVKEIVEFAKKYPVDGINLDYMRTQGVSYSKTAAELYRRKYGADINELKNTSAPGMLDRMLEWQESAASDVVARVRAGLRTVRLNIALTISGHPLPKPHLHPEGRNEWLWLEKGWIDAAFSMDYEWDPSFVKFEKVRAASSTPGRFALMLGNYDRIEGKATYRKAEQVAALVDYSLRKFPGSGIAIYLYSRLGDEQIAALRAGPFKENAVPSWKVPTEHLAKPLAPPAFGGRPEGFCK
jgi:hypothetical protein